MVSIQAQAVPSAHEAATEVLKECVIHEVYLLRSTMTFNDEGKAHISEQCFFPILNVAETCKVSGEKTEKECSDVSTHLFDKYYKHEAELHQPTVNRIESIKADVTDIFYVPYQQFSDGTPATIFLTNARNKQCSKAGIKWYAARMHDLENKNTKDMSLCWAMRELGQGSALLLDPSTGSIQRLPPFGPTESALKSGAYNTFTIREGERQQEQFKRVLKANCGGAMNPC